MAEENAGGVAKKFLYVNRKAPYGTIYALESLEVVLIGAAFEQDVSLAFLGDGVYQLVEGPGHQGGLGMKNFSPTFRAARGGPSNAACRFRAPRSPACFASRVMGPTLLERLSALVDKGNSKYLYELFPYGPAKQACKYAGLPKPTGCV